MPETRPISPIPRQIEQGIERLSTLLDRGPVALLSGAGLSTASGIPAYRDRHGQWQHSQPIQHQDFLRSEAVRQRYWARSFAGWASMALASPAAGHRALTRMEEKGIVSAVVTQNVDGLHQKAGSRSVIELHGGIDRVLCLACGERFPRASVQHWLAAANPEFTAGATQPAPDGDAQLPDAAAADFRIPGCPSCNGTLKPDVVFFGDSVPRERVAAPTSSSPPADRYTRPHRLPPPSPPTRPASGAGGWCGRCRWRRSPFRSPGRLRRSGRRRRYRRCCRR
jgi:NAD-dependent SIR2 family protein deacetylase